MGLDVFKYSSQSRQSFEGSPVLAGGGRQTEKCFLNVAIIAIFRPTYFAIFGLSTRIFNLET